jgi:transporter family-2 protein
VSGQAALVVGVAVVAAATTVIQSQMLGLLEQRIGALGAALTALVIGGLVGGVLLAVLRPDLGRWREAPWWAWLAGILGFIVVLGISYAVPRIGITPTLSIVIATQLVVGVLLEQTGWFEATARPLDLLRVVGLVLLGTGAFLVVR